MNSFYVILAIVAGGLMFLGVIVSIIEKKLISDRELEYSKSINLTEIRNQLREKEKRENEQENDYYEPVIIESKTIDEKV